MKNLLLFTVLSLSYFASQEGSLSQDLPAQLEETTGGLTFTDGVFYPTHSIQGMVYNTNSQSYQLPPSSGGSSGANTPYTPIFNINDPSAVSAAIANLGNVREDSATYTDYIKSLSAALDAPGADTAAIQAALFAELKDAVTSPLTNTSNKGNDWSKVDLTGKFIWGYNFQGSGMTGTQLNAGANLIYANLSGLDLAGLDWSTKSIQGVNFAGVTGLNVASINASTGSYAQAKFIDVDLTGFNPVGKDIMSVYFDGVTGANFAGVANPWNPTDTIPQTFINSDASTLEIAGKSLQGRNFSNSTGLTAEKIASAGYASNCNLTGTGITPEALRAAILAAGGDPDAQGWDYIIYTDGIQRPTP